MPLNWVQGIGWAVGLQLPPLPYLSLSSDLSLSLSNSNQSIQPQNPSNSYITPFHFVSFSAPFAKAQQKKMNQFGPTIFSSSFVFGPFSLTNPRPPWKIFHLQSPADRGRERKHRQRASIRSKQNCHFLQHHRMYLFLCSSHFLWKFSNFPTQIGSWCRCNAPTPTPTSISRTGRFKFPFYPVDSRGIWG